MPKNKQNTAPHAKAQWDRSGLTPAATARFRRRVTAWFAQYGRDLPWRRTRDPYAILVSEMMCQQTQVATVLPYFDKWMRRFPDSQTLAAATEPEVMSLWQGLGYYSRARNLHRAAKAIAAAGHFPATLPQIRALPGVGRYTAGAISAFAFDQPAPLVDANIARLLARLFAIRDPIDAPSGLAQVWHHAETLQPPRHGRSFNAGLMEIGALICTPRAPRCNACPIADFCSAFATAAQENFPVKKPRPRPVHLSEPCALITRKGQILLQHQTGPRWRGLWKLPPLAPIPESPPALVLQYPFTHHKITLSVYPQKPPRTPPPACEWHSIHHLPDVPLAAAHRRALRQLKGKLF